MTTLPSSSSSDAALLAHSQGPLLPRLIQEVRVQASAALPISAVYLLHFLSFLVSQLVTGPFSAEALAAVGLSSFWFNVCACAPLVGLALGCDFLLPQAIGARNYQRAGHIAQRSAVALLLCSVAIAPLVFCAGSVFSFLKQQPEVVVIATSYTRWLVISLPALACFEVYKKLVNACGLYVPPLIIASSALGLQGGVAYYLMYDSGTTGSALTGRLDGVAVAYSAAMWCCVVGACIHLATHRYWRLPACACRRPTSLPAPYAIGDDDEATPLVRPHLRSKETSSGAPALEGDDASATPLLVDPHDVLDAALAPPLTLLTLFDAEGWREFLAAGIPALVMIVLEWGLFESLSVVAGLISAPVQAAHSVLCTLEFILSSPLPGIEMGLSLRAGKFMGARDPRAAIHATRAAFAVVGTFAVLAAVVLAACHGVIARVFTSDPETAALITRWSPLLCGVFFFDALQATAGGTLRGINKPIVGALSSVMSYVVIGFPLSYVLSVEAGLGLPGIWIGVGASVLSAFCIMATTLVRLDWSVTSEAVADAAALKEEKHGRAATAAAAGGVELVLMTDAADASSSRLYTTIVYD